MVKTKEVKKVIELLNKRLETLKKKDHRERIVAIKNPKKRHPAFKQIQGRIKELKYLKGKINEKFN